LKVESKKKIEMTNAQLEEAANGQAGTLQEV